MVGDADALVRIDLVCTLGEWDEGAGREALGRLIAASATDRYLMAAAMSSVNRQNLDGVLVAACTAPRAAVGRAMRTAAPGRCPAQYRCNGNLAPRSGPRPDGKFAAWQYAALGRC